MLPAFRTGEHGQEAMAGRSVSHDVARRCLRRCWAGRACEAGRLSHAQARHPEPGSERMMKAVRFSEFGGPEVLEIVDLPDPHPGPGPSAGSVNRVGPWAGSRL